MSDILHSLGSLAQNLGTLLVQLLDLSVTWSPLIAWAAWWLFAADWGKLWPVLGRGAWAPVMLLGILVALVWSALFPSTCTCLGLVAVPNFWWQLGEVGLFLGLAGLCGWLQGRLGWTPAQVDLDGATAQGNGTGHDPAHAPTGH